MNGTASTLISAEPDAALDVPLMGAIERPRAAARWGMSAMLFAVLVAWAWAFPYTGDGDSVGHYLNARDAAMTPLSALHAWARPICKLIMAPFASHGILAVRAAMAAVAALTCWHTIRLAEELKLPNSLLAGPMVLWQPMAFAIAADTMTEMPMALGIVIAIRLWSNGSWRASALLVGFLPAVRPEGFFIGGLWGLLLLLAPGASLVRRITSLAALAVGLVCWAAASGAMTWNHDFLYVLHTWNWPSGGYSAYGRGSLLHHFIRWPLYCGFPLTVLFILGIRPSWARRGMRLPLAVWGLVIGLHSILFWGGWFASCGYMRIMTCSCPITALVCLQGWNVAEKWFPSQRRLAAVFCTAWVFGQYALDPWHYDCFPLARCTSFIRDRHLLQPQTTFFAGNAIATAQLDSPAHPTNVVPFECDPEDVRKKLMALPLGAIGVWDDRQAPKWHGHRIADLAGHGFTVLYDTHSHIAAYKSLIGLGATDLHYVVLRKDAPFVEAKPPLY